MNIRLRRDHGSVLAGILIISFALGFMLAAYLSMVSAQHQSVTRSQVWNTCIPVMEGGVEEALAHLYQTKGTNLVSNGWNATNIGCFKWRTVGDGSALIVISNGTMPVIYATAHLRAPLRDTIIRRSVRVETRKDGLFTKGMVAKGQITFNGNNIVVDSFDSADPSYSSNGLYVVSRRKDNGDVATNSGLVNSLASGNANVFGHVSTGPGGTVGIGPGGAIGDLAWQASGSVGIQPGYFNDDMNVSFPEVTLPFGGGFTPGNATGYQYVISSDGDYRITSLTGSLLIKSNVQARLIVDSDINLTGNDKVIIQPGGSLNLYMAGAVAKIGGNGVINQGGNATNFFYWGTTTNTSLAINGNGSFTGVIYAPNASFQMNGGGSSSIEDVTGASVSKTVQMNGSFNFHYDENLGRLDLNRGFIVTSWTEI
ncbi:MAG: hypothetical protein K0Q55_3809 [Verrucomicrobia bacterium]|jgi:hypothetical protein|nr:hypothetical protein [Verrucomicrobiota bacterium]